MGAMTSQITSLTIVYSTVYSGADQRKHQSSASLAFVRGIGPVNSPHKWPVTRKMFPFEGGIMAWSNWSWVLWALYDNSDFSLDLSILPIRIRFPTTCTCAIQSLFYLLVYVILYLVWIAHNWISTAVSSQHTYACVAAFKYRVTSFASRKTFFNADLIGKF